MSGNSVLDSLDNIRLAYDKCEIDEKEKIRFYLDVLFAKGKPARELASELPVKSGTTAVKEIQDYMKRKDSDEAVAEEARSSLSTAIPKLDEVYTSPSGYFKIHYSTTGTNAVSKEDTSRNGIPAYIEAVGRSFDHVRKITCEMRGFRNPILEKEKKSFHVYVYDLKKKYGITIPSTYYNMTATNQRRASCSISIDNSYSASKGFKDTRDNCMRVTAAHEFFHAVQYAYNTDADNWWKEASATWNEDEIYDEVNDYIRYIGRVFATPENSLEKSSYGGVVFAKYLSEHLGGYNIIKRIWEKQGTVFDTSTKAIDAAIKERYAEKDLGSVFKEYAASNFNPAQYYRDGHLWKDSITIRNTHSSYPVDVQNGELDHLSSNYQLFKPYDTENRNLKIVVESSGSARCGFKIQCRNSSDNLCNMKEVHVNRRNNNAEITIDHFGDTYKEICLIPSNLEKDKDGAEYTYSASMLE